MLRSPTDIRIDGRTLADVLAEHAKWRRGEGGARANLARANLAGAYLADANLARADLAGCSGNGREIMSARLDLWPVTWTTAPDAVVTVQIGCQRHRLALWRKSDPSWIAAMDGRATDWWARMRDPLLALIEASPAAPYGKPRALAA